MCGSREDELISSVQPSQENSFVANLSLQVPLALGGQYPYPCSLNMVDDDKGFQHLLGMDYDFEPKCQLPSGAPRSDAPTSHLLPMSCGDSLFSEHLNSQVLVFQLPFIFH